MKTITCTHVLETLRQHRDKMAAYGVRSMALFGSVARNEATPESDVDILVEFEQPIGLFEFVRLQMELEAILGVSVDLIERDALRQEFRDNAIAESIYA